MEFLKNLSGNNGTLISYWDFSSTQAILFTKYYKPDFSALLLVFIMTCIKNGLPTLKYIFLAVETNYAQFGSD